MGERVCEDAGVRDWAGETSVWSEGVKSESESQSI